MTAQVISDHDLNLAITMARNELRQSGQWGPGTRNGEFPTDITATERWEFPLAHVRLDGGEWVSNLDTGRTLFYNVPPVPLGDGTPPVAKRRVLVCGTNTQLAKLFPGNIPGTYMHELAAGMGIAGPEFTQCTGIITFWPSLLGTRWYLDSDDRTLPAVLLSTGEMRNYPSVGGETVQVEAHLREVAELFGVRFEKITI
jgi:hypothetical protein